MTTETAIMPGSRLTPSQTTSAGTTGTGSHKSSRAPSLAATMTLEPTASTSLRITEISPHSSKMTKASQDLRVPCHRLHTADAHWLLRQKWPSLHRSSWLVQGL
ncbi:interleukin-15 receptor subunit alpha isoform 3 [Mus musculus]|uniref:Interleukin 15 receptor alpha chain isoform 2D n=3 Tax=Mus musculus TaxID=10090 RepID=Q810T6_MOUSE|nr:interleukin-15 receptor subunit alpha isoform 3 [Mus musculus]NP_001407246.1 interleukin-15 receptor subunit alpha isoform 3 [Mus musculus]AAO74885.1 interleukin 15 receptor alpha chain isoform 2D [Mus musculus]|eukprot:NP_001258427.1 interleukin-15 receptor subunit alpha isoform 3 [Mus musculus]